MTHIRTLSITASLIILSLPVLTPAPARASSRSLTPSERVALAEQKAKDNPALRGRWDRDYRTPASEASYQTDNLAQKVLSNFRQDEALVELPVRLKVSSVRGVVTLSGIARDQADIERIGQAVSAMEGVKEVRNELRAAKHPRELLED